jgi:hypothetical protein
VTVEELPLDLPPAGRVDDREAEPGEDDDRAEEGDDDAPAALAPPVPAQFSI